MTTTRVEHPLRKPCDKCGAELGYILERNGQDTVRCVGCDWFQYNAPKVETGRAPRTVTSVHNGIKPKQRARILMRASGRCELCGAKHDLHVGHILSVNTGLPQGLTEADLNSDENLCSLCAECNLGMGDEPMPLRLLVGLLLARLSRQGAARDG